MSAEKIKENALANLRKFRWTMNSLDTDKTKFLLPKPDNTKPLYFVFFVGWDHDGSGYSQERYWIFRIKSMLAPDGQQVLVGMTMEDRLGNEPDDKLISLLFNNQIGSIERKDISFSGREGLMELIETL